MLVSLSLVILYMIARNWSGISWEDEIQLCPLHFAFSKRNCSVFKIILQVLQSSVSVHPDAIEKTIDAIMELKRINPDVNPQ